MVFIVCGIRFKKDGKMTDRDYKIEFETIVQEVIAPVFQGLGFKKNGNNFYREINGIGQAFNVQQSQWNSKEDKSFVFNLGLIDKETYSEIYNKTIPKFPKEYDCEIRLRLGHLMNKGDKWYYLNKRTELTQLNEQINIDLKTYAVPFYEKYSDPRKWLEFFEWKYEPFMSPIIKFLILERHGQRKKAEILLNKIYNQALTPKPSVNEIHTKNGEIIRTESEPTLNKEWIGRLENFAIRKNVELKITTNNNILPKAGQSWLKKLFSSG